MCKTAEMQKITLKLREFSLKNYFSLVDVLVKMSSEKLPNIQPLLPEQREQHTGPLGRCRWRGCRVGQRGRASWGPGWQPRPDYLATFWRESFCPVLKEFILSFYSTLVVIVGFGRMTAAAGGGVTAVSTGSSPWWETPLTDSHTHYTPHIRLSTLTRKLSATQIRDASLNTFIYLHRVT